MCKKIYVIMVAGFLLGGLAHASEKDNAFLRQDPRRTKEVDMETFQVFQKDVGRLFGLPNHNPVMFHSFYLFLGLAGYYPEKCYSIFHGSIEGIFYFNIFLGFLSELKHLDILFRQQKKIFPFTDPRGISIFRSGSLNEQCSRFNKVGKLWLGEGYHCVNENLYNRIMLQIENYMRAYTRNHFNCATIEFTHIQTIANYMKNMHAIDYKYSTRLYHAFMAPLLRPDQRAAMNYVFKGKPVKEHFRINTPFLNNMYSGGVGSSNNMLYHNNNNHPFPINPPLPNNTNPSKLLSANNNHPFPMNPPLPNNTNSSKFLPTNNNHMSGGVGSSNNMLYHNNNNHPFPINPPLLNNTNPSKFLPTNNNHMSGLQMPPMPRFNIPPKLKLSRSPSPRLVNHIKKEGSESKESRLAPSLPLNIVTSVMEHPKPIKKEELNRPNGVLIGEKHHFNGEVDFLEHKQRKFLCNEPTCKKSFSFHWELKQHKISHMGIRLLCCGKCKKQFSQAESLNKHKC